MALCSAKYFCYVRRILIFIALTATFYLQAQSVLDYKVDGVQNGRTLKNFLEGEEAKHDLKFFFLSEWLDGITLNKRLYQVFIEVSAG